eukprot:1145469-Pelagomonas_calceolata.AAC.2
MRQCAAAAAAVQEAVGGRVPVRWQDAASLKRARKEAGGEDAGQASKRVKTEDGAQEVCAEGHSFVRKIILYVMRCAAAALNLAALSLSRKRALHLRLRHHQWGLGSALHRASLSNCYRRGKMHSYALTMNSHRLSRHQLGRILKAAAACLGIPYGVLGLLSASSLLPNMLHRLMMKSAFLEVVPVTQ